MKVNTKEKKTKLDITLTFIVNLCKLNVLLILFTLAGLVAAGIFPAAVSAFIVARKWLLTKDYSITIKEFYTHFKNEFFKANKLGLFLTIPGIVLFVNYHLLRQFTTIVPIIIPVAFYVLLFLYASTLMWVFPLYVHRESHLFITIKNALIIGIVKIPITIILMISIFTVLYLSLALPTMLLFFTFSILAIIWMKWGLNGLRSVKFIVRSDF